MDLVDWLPPLTTTGLFAAALWLGRNLILTRLSKGVAHEFDVKLEALRAQLRESEEHLKADLRAKESEIAVVRSGALAALANRQTSVDKRRIEAVDQIWNAVINLGPARTVSQMMAYVNFEEAVKAVEGDPRGREVFELLGFGFDPKSLDLSSAGKARPFVTPMVWAQYSALVAACLHAVARWQLLKSGLGAKNNFINDDAVNKLIMLALPHQTSVIEKFGPSVYHLILEELETCLLRELGAMLAGADADLASVEQASKIVAASNVVIEQVSAKKLEV